MKKDVKFTTLVNLGNIDILSDLSCKRNLKIITSMYLSTILLSVLYVYYYPSILSHDEV